MTARTTPAPSGGIGRSITDGLLVGWRNLKRIPRIPELAIFAILQSIMFVLLFVFVFGGAINVPGDYTSFLMPGIFAQTIVFAAGTTAIGMTDDVNKGIIDRFRSLPMSRSAVLTGRTFSDVIYNAGILVVLMLTGFVVGWRVDEHPVARRGLRAAAVLRLRDGLARRLAGVERPDGRSRPAGDLHGAVPDHLHLERLRPGLETLPTGSSRSPSGTRRAR